MGIALCFKPQGIGSQDYLKEVKSAVGFESRGRRGIGHTGTLDPFASGLLCVGWGEGTKLLAALKDLPKLYRAGMLVEYQSETLDIENELQFSGPVVSRKWLSFSDERLKNFLSTQTGVQKQRVPKFSAVKIEGKRAYDLARSGAEIDENELPTRDVTVFYCEHRSLKEQSWQGKERMVWEFDVMASAGTYIRAFARDWAQELAGAPACLLSLQRLQVGPWRHEATSSAPKILELEDFRPLFDFVTLSSEQEERLLKGGLWNVRSGAQKPQFLINSEGRILGWCESQSGLLKRVFPKDPLIA